MITEYITNKNIGIIGDHLKKNKMNQIYFSDPELENRYKRIISSKEEIKRLEKEILRIKKKLKKNNISILNNEFERIGPYKKQINYITATIWKIDRISQDICNHRDSNWNQTITHDECIMCGQKGIKKEIFMEYNLFTSKTIIPIHDIINLYN